MKNVASITAKFLLRFSQMYDVLAIIYAVRVKDFYKQVRQYNYEQRSGSNCGSKTDPNGWV